MTGPSAHPGRRRIGTVVQVRDHRRARRPFLRGTLARGHRRAEAELRRLPNYRSYLACGGDHCVLPRDTFFTVRAGGVPVRDWVQRLATGRNVGCPICAR
jgi:hypothetical protein